LLAEAPSGYPETLLLAHGFKTKMLAGLVHEGLATVQRESVRAGDQMIKAAHIAITEAGQRALGCPCFTRKRRGTGICRLGEGIRTGPDLRGKWGAREVGASARPDGNPARKINVNTS